MTAPMSPPVPDRQRQPEETRFDGPLAPYLAGRDVFQVAIGTPPGADAAHDAVFSLRQLQDIDDAGSALRTWFAALRVGGHLVVVVPHAFLYERQLELPTALNPGQRRLYSPGVLMRQVEEALPPDSYRVRMLGDDDGGYDYDWPVPGAAGGHSDILLVLERTAAPPKPIDASTTTDADTARYALSPSRMRIDGLMGAQPRKILILKLDHMGDFIMALPALRHARALFAQAEITLVVGSWNHDTACASGVADRVVAFDAFPRNSTEEEPNVWNHVARFKDVIPDRYDLAIDLRADYDTRRLVYEANARIRAGIGTRAMFPYLDIFLPLDFNRNKVETAQEYRFASRDFIAQGPAARHDHRIVSVAGTVERFCAIIWGPYRDLRSGHYVFEPWFELDRVGPGRLLMDVGLDTKRVVSSLVPSGDRVRLPFAVDKPSARFEFRIWTVPETPSIDFSFFGGRLIRAGGGSVLHQSEYLSLLVSLVKMRLDRMAPQIAA